MFLIKPDQLSQRRREAYTPGRETGPTLALVVNRGKKTETTLNARKETCRLMIASLGAITELVEYLGQNESLLMQSLSKNFYNMVVPRA